MKIYKDELYFFLHNWTNDRKIRNLIDAFCWKSLPVSSGIEKKFHDLLSPRFRLLTKSRSIARSDISRGAVGKVDIERHGGGRWRAGVACVARVSNAQVSWQIEALCRDNGEFISGPAGATM